MSSVESADQVDFIGVDYNGRKALVPRDPDYDVTILAIIQAFKSLHDVSPHHITISTFVQELDDKFELPREIWARHLPRISRVSVSLDGASPERKHRKKKSHKIVKIEPVRLMDKPPSSTRIEMLPVAGLGIGTVPTQPDTWPSGMGKESYITVRVHPSNAVNFKTRPRILVEPSTTLEDLRNFIQSRVFQPGNFILLYYYKNKTLDGYRTVGDLELGNTSDNVLSVHVLDL